MTAVLPDPVDYDTPTVTVHNERTAADVRWSTARWRDTANEAGDGSLTVQIFNEGASVAPGDLLTFTLAGNDAKSIRAQRFIRKTVDPLDANRTVTISGAGHLIDWSTWIIETPNGVGVKPEAYELRYDWTTCDISGWDTPNERSILGDRTKLPPYGLAGGPTGFPNTLANWIAPRAPSGGGTGADPTGVFYAGLDFTTGSTLEFIAYWVADDLCAPALDGVIMDVFANKDAMASYQSHARRVTVLPSGSHKWRVKVENLPRSHPQNCGLFALAGAYRTYSGVEVVDQWLHTTGIADGWKTLDYGEPEPGFTWGEIIADLLSKAQAESRLTGWTLSFDDAEDTDGNAWPVVQQRFRTGMSLLDCLKQGAAAGQLEFRARPGELILDAWVAGAAGGSKSDIIYSDCSSLTHDDDFSGVVERVLVRDEQGQLQWIGSSTGPAAYLELGTVDEQSAIEDAAEAAIDARDEASSSVKLVHLPLDPQDGPYGTTGYQVFDTMGVPNESVSGHDTLRCVELVVDVDRLGRPAPTATFKSVRALAEERLAIQSQRSSPGLATETAAPALPGQPAATTVEMFTQRFSWSGPADALETGVANIGPPWEVERPLRVHRMEVRVNSDGGGSTDTVVKLYSGGSALPLGLGVVTLGDTDVFGSTDLIYLAQPGEVLQARITTQGKHTTGTITYFGGYLPQ